MKTPSSMNYLSRWCNNPARKHATLTKCLIQTTVRNGWKRQMKGWSRTFYILRIWLSTPEPTNPWCQRNSKGQQETHSVTCNIPAKHASRTHFYLKELGGLEELPGYQQKNIKMGRSPQDSYPFLQQVNGMEKRGRGGWAALDYKDLR